MNRIKPFAPKEAFGRFEGSERSYPSTRTKVLHRDERTKCYLKAFWVIIRSIFMITPQLMDEIKKRLIQTYNPVEMYLFGSYAWGHPDEESDLDLLIIVDECDPKERYKAMSEGHKALFGLDLSKDIIVLSEKEFEEASKNPQRIFYRIKQEGKKIYARA